MKRRSFLGGLAGGVAAGPGIANSAITGGLGQQATRVGVSGAYAGAGKNMIGLPSDYDPVAEMARSLAHHRENAAEMKAQQRTERSRQNDEADVLALRSVSHRHKVRMLIEREVEREHRLTESSLMRQLRRLQERVR